MTNEELAALIEQGNNELMSQLWIQVEKFVKMEASRYYDRMLASRGSLGFEKCDLVQVGYYALSKAVLGYNRVQEYTFLTFLKYALWQEFRELAGTRKKDLMRDAESLNWVSPDSNTCLLDTIVDPSTEGLDSIESQVEERIYQRQLRDTLEESIKLLTKRQQVIIRKRYFEGLNRNAVATDMGRSNSTIGALENSALKTMYERRKETGLDQYYDVEPNYYQRAGVSGFKTTWTSSVENVVFKQERDAMLWLKRRVNAEKGR